MLETAAEKMMVDRDFQAAFDTCDRGLQSLRGVEPEDSRSAELKAGLCILGIQALAELNQWPAVLSWVVQQYEQQERIPAKIMQMCILLYSKVGEPAVMQEAARVWLHCPSNSCTWGFRTVAELYLLHVLVPLGHTDEARELVGREIGAQVFTEDQREAAMSVVEERERQDEEPPGGPDSQSLAQRVSNKGSVVRKLEAMLSFLYRTVFQSSSGSFSLRKVFLLTLLLYMLCVRMDPALPSSFLWISKLLQLLRQMWNSVFAPHYRSLTH